MVAFTVYAPTNRGLQFVRERGLEFVRTMFDERIKQGLELNLQDQRGEDIPRLVDATFEDEEGVIGITGQDLLDNYVCRQESVPDSYANKDTQDRRRSQLLVSKLGLKNKGAYEGTLFGLPTLCILGYGGIPPIYFMQAYPKVRDLDLCELRGTELQEPNFSGKTIAIPARYEALIRSRVRLDGATLLPLDGKVDVTAARGEADYAVDIVLSGKTAREEGLGFFPPLLYQSDGVVIGNKKATEKPCVVFELSEFERWLTTGHTSDQFGIRGGYGGGDISVH